MRHSPIYSIAILVLLFSCTPQKSDTTRDSTDSAQVTEIAKPAITVFNGINPDIKNQLKGFLSDYFALNQTLIMDNLTGASEVAGKFSDRIKKFEIAKLTPEQMDFYYIQVSTLTQGLKQISESTDIEVARLALAAVSESMYALTKAYHPGDTEVYYQYCPMARNGKGANWLSSTKEIANPYMGQMMPECGRTQETLH